MEPLKSVLLNTYDTSGGAALATYRLHRGLRGVGVDSSLLVQRRYSADPSVLAPQGALLKAWASVSPHLDRLPLKAYPNYTKRIYSPAIMPGIRAGAVRELNPDVVHLFWVTGGFVRPETLAKIDKPLIWTLHDMWPFSGGCHYDEECGRFRQDCGNCPILGSTKPNDFSRRLLHRKREAWRDVNLTVVATSRWMADCARESTLFRNRRIEVIPNGFDVSKYKPLDKQVARQAFNLPANKRLVLFSSFSAVSDPRKGFQHLIPALQNLSPERKAEIELVVLGAARPEKPVELGMPAHYIEHLDDEISQVLLYSAVDALVLPSLQENLANTVIEAMLCGVPVVAFAIGGMLDSICHGENGYLATPFDAADLGEGIWSVISDAAAHRAMSTAARASAKQQYDVRDIALRYRELYQDVSK